MEELKKVKKMEEDVPEELPITNRRSASAAKIQRKIKEMRAESGKMRRDAPRTPTSLRKVKKNVRNSNVSLSPSLKCVKVANLRKIFEPGLTDRDALPTTSPPKNGSEFKSKLNLSNYADQWQSARHTGLRQVAGSGLRPSCDWKDASLVDRKDQTEDLSHHQDGFG